MNKQALDELTGKCYECIEAWKKDNWHQPIDIQWGSYIEHCRMYGGDDIQNIYEKVWDGAPEDDSDVQNALRLLEKELLILNVGEEQGERIYIGRRIAELRAEVGMTQQELADTSGIKQGNIARIEGGKYNFTLDTLTALASAMGKNIDIV